MSKKRSVSYIKPQEPAFLTRLKEQAGFIEGPTVETKRQSLPDWDVEEGEVDKADEAPVVVVVNPGDLTQEEADLIKRKAEEEEENRPAQLDKRIIFKSKNKRPSDDCDKSSKKPKRKIEKNSNLLSFGSDEEED